jgi:hypothetical protein
LSERSKPGAGGRAARKEPGPPPVWRLASGQSLAEFAFGAGLIAPGLLGPRLARLFRVEPDSGRGGRKPGPERR